MTESEHDDDPLESAWVTLLEEANWPDESRHRAFVGLAATLDRLADAAARYRAVETDPVRREGAERGKQLVLSSAMALIATMPRTSAEQIKKRARTIVPIAVLGVMFAANFVLAGTLRQPRFMSAPAFMLEILIVVLLPWRRLVP